MTSVDQVLTAEVGEVLPALARAAVADEIGAPAGADVFGRSGGDPELYRSELEAPGACFVTLLTDGRLHGCIGSLEPRRSLAADVDANARAAAVRDRRFPPLTPAELSRTRVEVSVLSPARLRTAPTEEDALALLRPGVDGVVLRWREHRATFLPSVWATIADPREFIARLRAKAGIPQGLWNEEVALETYTVDVFEDEP